MNTDQNQNLAVILITTLLLFDPLEKKTLKVFRCEALGISGALSIWH